MNRQVKDAWRRVISTNDGQVVLTDLCHYLHFFEEVRNEEDVIQQNVAKWVLRRAGIFAFANGMAIVRAFSWWKHKEKAALTIQAFLGIPVRDTEAEETRDGGPERSSWDPLGQSHRS